MGVTDRKIMKDSKIAIERVPVEIITAISLTDVIAGAHQPGYPFEIVEVESYARVEAGVVTADVKIGTVSALAAVVAFATATRAKHALAAPLASRRGSATDVINVHYTSDGSGVLTNARVVVSYRPVPLNGDVETE